MQTPPAIPLPEIERALLDLAQRQRTIGRPARAEGTLAALTKLRALAKRLAPPTPG